MYLVRILDPTGQPAHMGFLKQGRRLADRGFSLPLPFPTPKLNSTVSQKQKQKNPEQYFLDPAKL
jgi:hypothetical protein